MPGVDITPAEAVFEWGYAERNRPYQSRQAPTAKALAVEDPGGGKGVPVRQIERMMAKLPPR